MAEIHTFAQCLNKLMEKHKLSPNQLAFATGCSRTEIKHILLNEANENKRKALFLAIKQNKIFDDEDLLLLSTSLEVSRIGVERYRFQIAIDHILSGKYLPVPHPIKLQNGVLLSERLQEFLEAEQVEILCLNSCFPSVFQTLQPLFSNPQKEIHMWHLLNLEGYANKAASIVAYTSPLLFDKRYQPYGVTIRSNEELPSIGGNLLCIKGTVDQKQIEFFCNIISTSEAYELSNAAECGMFAYISQLFKTIHPVPSPLKETQLQKENFSTLCMTFLSHELNRATYSLTNGICFQQIPLDIAVAAIRDCPNLTPEEADEIISTARNTHEQRFQNLYNKKKPAYLVMTQDGCKQFLKTGYTLDHFVGFRAFRPEERKVIFEHFLQNARNNAYFTPLILKENTFKYHFNMECYDKLGVLLDAKDSNYDLKNGYRSVFLMYPDFTRQYLSYYLETLVSVHSHTQEKSIQILEELFHSFLRDFHLDI